MGFRHRSEVCRSRHEEAEGGLSPASGGAEPAEDTSDGLPRSLVPRPEGYRGRSSVPPPKPQSIPPRSSQFPPDDVTDEDRITGEGYTPTPRSGGPALMPMRIIAVKGEMGGPPPLRDPGYDSVRPVEPGRAVDSGRPVDSGRQGRSIPDVEARPSNPLLTPLPVGEPPPLPGSLPPVTRSSPGHEVPLNNAVRVVPPVVALQRPEPPLPSAPRVEPPMPSSPRAEPPLPPLGRRASAEPPALPSQPDSVPPRSQVGEPPPLPGAISRPAPARPSRNPRSQSGEPPPLPKGSGRTGTEAGNGDTAAAELRPSQRGVTEPRATTESAEDIELESIPPPSIEIRNADALQGEEGRSLVEEARRSSSNPPGRAPRARSADLDTKADRVSAPPRNSIPGTSEASEDGDLGDTASRPRPRPAPPSPPLRAAAPRETREPDVEVTIETSVSGPESAETSKPPRKRRLPPTPPPRTSLTGAPEEDSKRRHWWEELFSDDFLRADLELTDSQLNAEVDFIQESLNVERGGLILDLACGNGRHAIELARRGYTAVGYELSLSQLARASERAQRAQTKVSFLHGDMREMSFEPTFDGIYCWNASFGYFEEERNQGVLRNIFRALKPGGSLLLDIPNRDFVACNQPGQNWFEGDGCVCMDDMHVDFITSRLVVKRTIMLDDGRNRECTYSIRLYGLHELGRMLHEAGFRVGEVSGHIAMRGVFMGATSPRLMLLVAKP